MPCPAYRAWVLPGAIGVLVPIATQSTPTLTQSLALHDIACLPSNITVEDADHNTEDGFSRRRTALTWRNTPKPKPSLSKMELTFVPDDAIPRGDETDRLHRWGYQHYREMFNARQLLGLELSCRAIARLPDERVRHALATNLSDLLRYQNMLCRYDTMALKSLDIFSVHGFPVGLVQCESNFLGITNGAQGQTSAVGDGGTSSRSTPRPKRTVATPSRSWINGKKGPGCRPWRVDR